MLRKFLASISGCLVLVIANDECWMGPLTSDFCCGDHLGPGGNPVCWVDHFTYEYCCLNQAESTEATAEGSLMPSLLQDDFDCWHWGLTEETCCQKVPNQCGLDTLEALRCCMRLHREEVPDTLLDEWEGLPTGRNLSVTGQLFRSTQLYYEAAITAASPCLREWHISCDMFLRASYAQISRLKGKLRIDYNLRAPQCLASGACSVYALRASLRVAGGNAFQSELVVTAPHVCTTSQVAFLVVPQVASRKYPYGVAASHVTIVRIAQDDACFLQRWPVVRLIAVGLMLLSLPFYLQHFSKTSVTVGKSGQTDDAVDVLRFAATVATVLIHLGDESPHLLLLQDIWIVLTVRLLPDCFTSFSSRLIRKAGRQLVAALAVFLLTGLSVLAIPTVDDCIDNMSQAVVGADSWQKHLQWFLRMAVMRAGVQFEISHTLPQIQSWFLEVELQVFICLGALMMLYRRHWLVSVFISGVYVAHVGASWVQGKLDKVDFYQSLLYSRLPSAVLLFFFDKLINGRKSNLSLSIIAIILSATLACQLASHKQEDWSLETACLGLLFQAACLWFSYSKLVLPPAQQAYIREISRLSLLIVLGHLEVVLALQAHLPELFEWAQPIHAGHIKRYLFIILPYWFVCHAVALLLDAFIVAPWSVALAWFTQRPSFRVSVSAILYILLCTVVYAVEPFWHGSLGKHFALSFL